MQNKGDTHDGKTTTATSPCRYHDNIMHACYSAYLFNALDGQHLLERRKESAFTHLEAVNSNWLPLIP